MSYRLLEYSDLNKGFLELLSELTIVGNISKKEFIDRFLDITSNPLHKIYVLEQNNKIISCGTLLLEPKFIHECGITAHIEDIVVSSMCRGKGYGKKIINFLSNEAKKLGCYKIILDCSEEKIEFYKKCNYIKKGVFMAKYLDVKKNKDMSYYKKTLKNIDNFCKNNYKLIILINFLLFISKI